MDYKNKRKILWLILIDNSTFNFLTKIPGAQSQFSTAPGNGLI
jgi:hypothetical protein